MSEIQSNIFGKMENEKILSPDTDTADTESELETSKLLFSCGIVSCKVMFICFRSPSFNTRPTDVQPQLDYYL